MSSPKEEKRPHKWNVKLFGFLFPFPSIYTISRKRIAFRLERCNWSDSQFICDNRLVNVESDCVLNCGIFNKRKHKSNGYISNRAESQTQILWTFCTQEHWTQILELCSIVLLFKQMLSTGKFSTRVQWLSRSQSSIIFLVLSPYFRFL